LTGSVGCEQAAHTVIRTCMTVLLHFDCSMVLTLLQALCKCLVSRCATHFFKIFFGFFVIYIYIFVFFQLGMCYGLEWSEPVL
jgi:hypothetical protein